MLALTLGSCSKNALVAKSSAIPLFFNLSKNWFLVDKEYCLLREYCLLNPAIFLAEPQPKFKKRKHFHLYPNITATVCSFCKLASCGSCQQTCDAFNLAKCKECYSGSLWSLKYIWERPHWPFSFVISLKTFIKKFKNYNSIFHKK